MDAKKPDAYRLKLIMFYLGNGRNTSLTARTFAVSRPTVIKWVHRYEKQGASGLVAMSNAPKHIPHKTNPAIEEKVINLRTPKKRLKTRIGPIKIRYFLKKRYGLVASTGAIYRILKQNGLIKRRRKKWQNKRQIASYRAALKPLELLQTDAKHLVDQPNLFKYVDAGLFPAYQFTSRCPKTGLTFMTYAHALSQYTAVRHIALLLAHIRNWCPEARPGIQTDNGQEFIGNIGALESSEFSKTVESWKLKHITIPPATPKLNGSVEHFHGRVEPELYEVERFRKIWDFLGKAYSYMLYYNFERPNMNLEDRTPWEAFKEWSPIPASPRLADFPPVVLDSLPLKTGDCRLKSVNDLPEYISVPRKLGLPLEKRRNGHDLSFGRKRPLPACVFAHGVIFPARRDRRLPCGLSGACGTRPKGKAFDLERSSAPAERFPDNPCSAG